MHFDATTTTTTTHQREEDECKSDQSRPRVIKNSIGLTMHEAVQLGMFDVQKGLLWFLTQGCNVDSLNDVGESVAHIAAREGHKDIIGILINQRANLLLPNIAGRLPLHLAAKGGHDTIVVDLANATPEALGQKDSIGKTPLETARSKGKEGTTAILEALQQSRIESSGMTVHQAAERGLYDGRLGVRYFWNHGCDVNAVDANGDSVLHIAARRADMKVFMAASQANVSPLLRNNKGQTALHIAAEGTLPAHTVMVKNLCHNVPALIDIENNEGNCAIHLAAAKGALDSFNHLLETQRTLDVFNRAGDCPVHMAARNEHVDIIKACRDRHYSLGKVNPVNGNTPLHSAVIAQKTTAALHLIEYRVNTNLANKAGETAINIAAKHDMVAAVVTMLRQNNGLANTSHLFTLDTPLHTAVKNKSLESVSALAMVPTIKLKQINKEGNTPLHIAAMVGNFHMLRTLITNCQRRRIAVDLVNPITGNTPLHLARFANNAFMSSMLVDAGAQEDVTNLQGETPTVRTRVAEGSRPPRVMHHMTISPGMEAQELTRRTPPRNADRDSLPVTIVEIVEAGPRGNEGGTGAGCGRGAA
jgi:ankyrin repeat protein